MRGAVPPHIHIMLSWLAHRQFYLFQYPNEFTIPLFYNNIYITL